MLSPTQILTLLWRLILWRHWMRSWKSTLVLILTLSLGVGVFFAIRLANRSAVAGFSLFSEVVIGESDLILTHPSGTLSLSLLPELRSVTSPLPAHFYPILESTATLPHSPDDPTSIFPIQFQVVGLDLPSHANLLYLTPSSAPAPRLPTQRPSTKPPSSLPKIYVSQALADQFGWSIESKVDLIWNTTLHPVQIGGLIPHDESSPEAPTNLLVMDLPDLQNLLDSPDSLHRIEIRLPPGSYQSTWLLELEARLRQAAQGRWEVHRPQTLRDQGQNMTRAFRLNLTILSGLALLVGTFLIFQTLETSVIRKRQEIGILRSLGIPPAAIRLAWLSEALLLGMMGSTLGLLLGYGGAQVAVRLVARTVNALYFSNTVSAAQWNLPEAFLAFFLGLLACLLAGWWPSREASLTPPAEILRRSFRGGGLTSLQSLPLGLAFLLAGTICYFLPPIEFSGKTYFPLAGYSSALLLTLGGSIAVSGLLHWIPLLTTPFSQRFASWKIASTQLGRPTGRHRLSLASLLTAFSLASAMSLLVGSFEFTMKHWIEHALRADLFIAPQGIGNVSNQNRIEPEVQRALQSHPKVQTMEIGQYYTIQFQGGTTYLIGANAQENKGWRNLLWIHPPPHLHLRRQPTANPTQAYPAWVNESFLNRYRLKPGSNLELPTPSGPQPVQIQGVYSDFGNERGSIMVDLDALNEWFQNDKASNLAVYLQPGTPLEAVRQEWLKQYPGLNIRANQRIREDVLTIFRQTFAVTHALKWIALVVAWIGLALTLIHLTLERRKEFSTLTTLGMSHQQVGRTVALEAFLLSLLGVLAGTLLSLALGAILIFVINKQSFGWTLIFHAPWLDFLFTGTLACLLGAWVGYRVGLWAAKIPADHEE